MQSRLLSIILIFGALAAAAVIGCGDVERFPSTSLTIEPDAITDAVLTLDETDGSAVLTWTVPRTHGGTTGLRRYDLRFDYSGDFEWSQAERVTTPPVPAKAGETQSYRFVYPRRGRVLGASVRAIDNSGNQSDVGNVAALLIPGVTLSGVSVDYLTGEPANVVVTLSTSEITRTTAPDATGRWAFEDLPESVVSVRIADPGPDPTVFPLETGMTLTEDMDLNARLIPYQRSVVYPTFSLLTLFMEAAGLRGTNFVLRTWPSRPVDIFVPEYVTPGGLDYRATAIAAIDRWMELTEIELFRVVEAPPASGVRMEFLSSAEMGTQIGVTTHVNTPDGTPLRSDIAIVNIFENPIALNRVMMHELGHTLRLSHLPTGYLMYAGQPLPDDPTADEVWFVRLLCSIPDRTDLSIYNEVGE